MKHVPFIRGVTSGLGAKLRKVCFVESPENQGVFAIEFVAEFIPQPTSQLLACPEPHQWPVAQSLGDPERSLTTRGSLRATTEGSWRALGIE
jgi:hypothetical protein